MQPLATVLLPTFNSELHVEEAVLSILRQTFDDFELVVVDDGSTDRTPEIVSSFGDPRVRVERFARNRGISHALNHGIALSASRYIVRMDADDVSVPHRLATQVAYMEAHPDVGVCGTHMAGFGDYECIFAYPTGHDELKVSLLSYNAIGHPSVVLRRAALAADGLRYRDRYRHAEDYDLWVRCAQRCRIANLPEPLVRYRVHDFQVSNRFARTQSASAARVRLRQAQLLCDGLTRAERRAYAALIEGRAALAGGADRAEAERLKEKLLARNAAKGTYDAALLRAALDSPSQLPPILELRGA